MDPDETLALLIEALKDGDRANAIEAAEHLAGWLEDGGFAPEVDGDDLLVLVRGLAGALERRQP